jgi:DNA repair protein RadD
MEMINLRWYQNESIDALFPFFNKPGSGNPLVGLPTGTGKSLSIGGTVKAIHSEWSDHRGLVITHDKRLIEQNAAKLMEMWPNAPVGICSAGLNRRDVVQPIVFGGIGTMVGDPAAFGRRNYILVDEAHMISDKSASMYQRLIANLQLTNPEIVIAGWSATLYRNKMGELNDNGIFTDVAYDLTDINGFNKLLAEGHIANLVPQPTQIEFDTSGIKISNGDFSEAAMQAAFDKNELTWKCCEEMVRRASDRKCWLVFATGTDHCDHIAEALNLMGIRAASVHSKKKAKENDELIAAFKRGEIRCLVNMGMLTTGFDWPPVDFIGMMRPTMSPGLWVQMLGRGTRPYDGRYANQYRVGFEYIKENCLVLDFARNVPRLGPINDPRKPRKPGKGGGDVPIKICPNCGSYNHASTRFCVPCGHEFPLGGAKIFMEAGSDALIKGNANGDAPNVQWFDVSHVLYSRLERQGSPLMMKVSYICGVKQFTKVICMEHKTYAKHLAHEWWRQVSDEPIPQTTMDALEKSSLLAMPKKIRVWTNREPYPEVLNMEY